MIEAIVGSSAAWNTMEYTLPFSVIVPTKNRAGDLDALLQSVIGQTRPPRQIVIVDQSEDRSAAMLVERRVGNRAQELQPRLCYVHDTSIPSGAVARNRAMELAQEEILLFLDDDVYLETDFLEQLWSAYEAHPEACGISGIITNYPRPAWEFRLWSSMFVRGPFRDDRQPVYWNAERLRQADPVRVTRLGGGLMSFRASAVKHLRFDEHLVGVSDGEDVDFCMRLPPGSVLFIAPKARLVHNQSPSGRLNDHWLRRSARASWFLYRKNWRNGIRNRICFLWLNTGYVLVATVASLRQQSLHPWTSFLRGVREAADHAARSGLA